jgi:hypothetical protein
MLHSHHRRLLIGHLSPVCSDNFMLLVWAMLFGLLSVVEWLLFFLGVQEFILLLQINRQANIQKTFGGKFFSTCKVQSTFVLTTKLHVHLCGQLYIQSYSIYNCNFY